MQYQLCDNTWDKEEINAINRVVQSNQFSMGKEVKQYEIEFAKKFGVKYAVMTSSGSAANLLAVAALIYSGYLQKGDEVLVPAVSWSTTYFPLYQMGLKLRFLDIDKNTLNFETKKIEEALTPNTKMICAVNLLGNPNEFDIILEICQRKHLLLIEDNCEALGGIYKGKQLGTLGLLGTYSTFYSHHLCTMEGGVTVTNNEELYHYMLVIRAHGWTRNLPKNSSIYQKSENQFYESYHFILPGFNLRPIEMEGAIGREQLKKMDQIIKVRRENAVYFAEKLSGWRGIRIQKEIEKSSWFGFAIVLEEEYKGKRDSVVKKLEAAGIEVRPVVAGNFTKNPVIRYMDYSIAGVLENADEVHENGFFIGNHGTRNLDKIDYFLSCFQKILSKI